MINNKTTEPNYNSVYNYPIFRNHIHPKYITNGINPLTPKRILGPVVNFHQKFINNTELPSVLGWRKYYLQNFSNNENDDIIDNDALFDNE